MNLRLVALADAESVRMPNPEIWGSYYAFAPRVYAVQRDRTALYLQRQVGTAAHV
jgi:hypothetical protein